MRTARFYLAAGVVNGTVYAVGGVNTYGNALSALECYRPNFWRPRASMPAASGGLAVGVVNGVLCAVEGGILEAYTP